MRRLSGIEISCLTVVLLVCECFAEPATSKVNSVEGDSLTISSYSPQLA